MDHSLVTGGFEVIGHRPYRRCLAKSVVGGNITLYSELCEKTRADDGTAAVAEPA